MSIRKRIALICFLCTLLCGCQKDKIVIEIPSGNEVANSYIDSAGKAFGEKDYYNALNGYLEVEKIYSNLNYSTSSEMAEIYNMIGRCYIQIREYYKAKDYFEKSLPISEKMTDEKLNFENYINLLEINYSIGDKKLDLALEYGRKAEETALNIYGDQSSELSEVYSDLGNVYCQKKEYDKAEEYMQKAFKIIEYSYGNNHEKSAVIYKELANIYEKQEKYDEAIKNSNKAADIFKKNNNEYWLAVVYGDLGNIYFNKEKYDKALEYYNKCLEIYNILGKSDFDLAEYHYWKAAALYKSKNYKDSKQEMLLAHQICESLPIKSELTEKLITVIKEDLKIYYDYNYEGDKSSGFEIWYEELISNQPEQ